MPALLTSTSRPPRSSSASSNHASISPSLATSTWVAAMSALSARNPSSAASSISQTCTLAPPLFVAPGELRLDDEGLARFHLAVLVEMGLSGEERASGCAVIIIIANEPEEGVEPITESEQVIGIRHMAVVVDPCRLHDALMQ